MRIPSCNSFFPCIKPQPLASMQLDFSDREIATDPVDSLFRASIRIAERALQVRQRAVGTTIDIGNGVSAVVTAVDGSNLYARSSDGTKHTVPFTSRRLGHLADIPKPTRTRRSPKVR